MDYPEFIRRLLQTTVFVLDGDAVIRVRCMKPEGFWAHLTTNAAILTRPIIRGIRLAVKQIRTKSVKFGLPDMQRLSPALYQILRPVRPVRRYPCNTKILQTRDFGAIYWGRYDRQRWIELTYFRSIMYHRGVSRGYSCATLLRSNALQPIPHFPHNTLSTEM